METMEGIHEHPSSGPGRIQKNGAPSPPLTEKFSPEARFSNAREQYTVEARYSGQTYSGLSL